MSQSRDAVASLKTIFFTSRATHTERGALHRQVGNGSAAALSPTPAAAAAAPQKSFLFCASIRLYRDIGSSFGHWSGHGKNLFIISISGCGHGTAAVGPDPGPPGRAGLNCDEPPTTETESRAP